MDKEYLHKRGEGVREGLKGRDPSHTIFAITTAMVLYKAVRSAQGNISKVKGFS